jgi:hypothetical protein
MTDTTIAKNDDPTDPRPPCERCGSTDHTTGFHDSSTENQPTGFHDSSMPAEAGSSEK